MTSILSHIIQKRFSQQYEDVATDALAYVLQGEPALNGMMHLLRGIVPDLPTLRFRTQRTEGTIRPDMWGFADTEARVFVENKFWAGLTDNQPVSYLKRLSNHSQPTVLLVIAPAGREQPLLRELSRRLREANVLFTERNGVAGMAWSVATQIGPFLALTSWGTVLSALEHEAFDDPRLRGDLVQLRALCDAADADAFIPVSSEETSSQRTPAFMLHLGSVVQEAVDLAVTEQALSVKRLNPQASWERIGRYARLGGDRGPGAWIEVHFGLWKSHGETPLWLIFDDTDFGRAREVRRFIEPWSSKHGVLAVTDDDHVAIALGIQVGEDKAGVVRGVVNDLKAIASVLGGLQSSRETQPPTDMR
jgi:hypothetical protein